MKVLLANEPPTPRARRAVRMRTLAAGALTLAVGAVVLRRRAAVGRFVSAAAKDDFLTAYDAAMAELPLPDRVLDVRTGFGVVRVHRFDDGAPGRVPLVLLPGRASASPMWKANLSPLLRHAPVYLLDLLGEPGRSVQDTPITDADDQARWLHEALAALPEERVDLLGVSMGGWMAVNLATRRPEKIRSLALLDPVLVFAPLAAAAVWRSLPVAIRLLPAHLREGFTSWTANGAAVRDVLVARMIAAGMQLRARPAYAPPHLREGARAAGRAGAGCRRRAFAHARLAPRRRDRTSRASPRPRRCLRGRLSRRERRVPRPDRRRPRSVPPTATVSGPTRCAGATTRSAPSAPAGTGGRRRGPQVCGVVGGGVSLLRLGRRAAWSL